jgi:hypothetical protein
MARLHGMLRHDLQGQLSLAPAEATLLACSLVPLAMAVAYGYKVMHMASLTMTSSLGDGTVARTTCPCSCLLALASLDGMPYPPTMAQLTPPLGDRVAR